MAEQVKLFERDLGAPQLEANSTAKFMASNTDAWQIGAAPTDPNVPVITQAIGNGQLGIGIKAPALDVATPLVFPPAIVVVLQVPAMYDWEGHQTAMAAAIKDMFESHAKQVTGIDIQYQIDQQGDLTLHDGQQFQAPGKTKRQAVSPSFTFTEVTGNLYWNIIKKWITDINNPDTYSIGANVHVSGGWTMSAYSMTIAVIQPDITGRPERIIDCSIICNMFPQDTGAMGVERTIGQIKAAGDRSITFTGIQQHNSYTKQLGKLIMQKLSMHQLDFDWAPPQRDIWTPSLTDAGLGPDREGRYKLYPRADEDKSNSERNVQISDIDADGLNHINGITGQINNKRQWFS